MLKDFKVKFQEEGGTPLWLMFPTSLVEGMSYGRGKCRTCQQKDEKKVDWKTKDKGVDECHMMEHEHAAHRGEDGSPAFRFKVVKGCRTALERQVREAVRIQQRRSVLNQRGEFNQCKITRMDVDVMWEQKCWDQAWVKRGDLERDEEANLTSRAKEKRRSVEEGVSMKRRNLLGSHQQ